MVTELPPDQSALGKMATKLGSSPNLRASLSLLLVAALSSHFCEFFGPSPACVILYAVGHLVDIATASLSARKSKTSRLSLPPGPPTLPLLGNLHQAPRHSPWLIYEQWSKRYGPFYMLNYAGMKFLMIHDYATAYNLLEKKGNIYSSRPQTPMADKVNLGMYPSLNTYDSNSRSHERLRVAYLGPRVAQSYRAVQDTESKQVLFELLSSNSFKNIFTRYATSMIFALAYGKRLTSFDDEEVQETQWILTYFLHIGKIGLWVIDLIPLLNRISNYLFPWARHGKKLSKSEISIHNRNMNNALASPSWNWCKHLLNLPAGKEMDRVQLAYDVGCVLCAATETTSNTLQFFILAAVLHPEVMVKAREEIDAVVGAERLPGFEDQDILLYIQAMTREVLRWLPTTNLGIPHSLTADDTHNGYFIPKGTTVIANHFAIFRDPAIYSAGGDPNLFIPERWLPASAGGSTGSQGSLPEHFFGWGRRSCPGHQIARNSLFIAVARLVWAFEIEGVGEKPDPLKQTEGFSQGPVDFEVKFTVREGREAIVREAWGSAEKDVDVLMKQVDEAQVNKI